VKPRAKASLLWGVIGALVFLVGLQALRLVTGEGVTLLVALVVALAVGIGAAGATYLLEGRVAKEQS
jgi:hypothetical protein